MGLGELVKQIADDTTQRQVMKYFNLLLKSFCEEHASNPLPHDCEKCKTMMSNSEAIRMLAYIQLVVWEKHNKIGGT